MAKSIQKLKTAFSVPKPQERTEVPEDTAKAFEQGAHLTSVPATQKAARQQQTESERELVVEKEVPQPETSSSRRKNKSRLRRDVLGERIVVYVPDEMAIDLRVQCAKDRRSVSDAMTEALSIWLKKNVK